MGSDVAYAGFDRGCLVAYNAASAMGGRPSDCFFGDTASTRTLVLMGDSNADMWLPAFDALGRTDHFRVELVARASCQLPDLALWDPVLHRPGTECSAFRRAAFRLIATVHPFATVLVDYEYGIRWNDEDQPYSPSDSARGITNTVRAVARHSGRVVMLGEPPAQFSDPVTCLETHEHNIAACDSPRVCATSLASTSSKCTFDPTTGRTWAYLPLLAHAVASGGGTYVPVTTLFCTPRACPSVVDHVVVMFDLRHVSEHYGELVAPALGTLLQRAGVPL
jgi:hypothetical protein